jgi:hypothetical protein
LKLSIVDDDIAASLSLSPAPSSSVASIIHRHRRHHHPPSLLDNFAKTIPAKQGASESTSDSDSEWSEACEQA